MNKYQTNPDELAFPASREFGLTKREYFAALALQGMLANPDFNTQGHYKFIPKKAVEVANLLIEELNKQ